MIFNSLYQGFNTALSIITNNIQFRAVISKDKLSKLNPFKLTMTIKYPKFWNFKLSPETFWPTISIPRPHFGISTIGNIPHNEEKVIEMKKNSITVPQDYCFSLNISNITPTSTWINFQINETNNSISETSGYNENREIYMFHSSSKKNPITPFLDNDNVKKSLKQNQNKSKNQAKYEMNKKNIKKFQNKSSNKICPNNFSRIYDLIFSSTSNVRKNKSKKYGETLRESSDFNYYEQAKTLVNSYKLFPQSSVKNGVIENSVKNNGLSVIPLSKRLYQNDVEPDCVNIDITYFIIFFVLVILSTTIFYFIKWTIKPLFKFKNPKLILNDKKEVVFLPRLETLPQLPKIEQNFGTFKNQNADKYTRPKISNCNTKQVDCKIIIDISTSSKNYTNQEQKLTKNCQPKLLDSPAIFFNKSKEFCSNSWHNVVSENRKFESSKDACEPISATSNDLSISNVYITSDNLVKSANSVQNSYNINMESEELPEYDYKMADNCDKFYNNSLDVPENVSFNIIDSEDSDDEEKIRDNTTRVSINSSCDMVEKANSDFLDKHDYNKINDSLNYHDFLFESNENGKLHSISNYYSPSNENDLPDPNNPDIFHSREFEQKLSLHQKYESVGKLDESTIRKPDSSQVLKSISGLSNIFCVKSPQKNDTTSKQFFNWNLSRGLLTETDINISKKSNDHSINSDKENRNICKIKSNGSTDSEPNSAVDFKKNQNQTMENDTYSVESKNMEIEKLYKILEEYNFKNFTVSGLGKLKSQCDLILDDYLKEISKSIIKVIEYKHLGDSEKEEIVTDLNNINKLVFSIDEIYSELDQLLHHEKPEHIKDSSQIFQAYSNRFKILFVQIESDLKDIYYQLSLIDGHIN